MSFDSLTLTQLQQEAARLQSLVGELSAKLADAQSLMGRVRSEVEKRTRPAPVPRLSDHALLRFIERVHGIDTKVIRERILSPTVIEAIKAGASAVTVDGLKMKVVDNTIVTVYEPAPVRNNPRKLRDTGIKSFDHLAEQMREAAE
jgi:hypothetical protein